MNNILNKILKEINFLKNKEDKLYYLIELGKKLPINKENIRINKNIIYGCQSNVWLKIKKKNNLILLNGDSNSLIIKGLLIIIINLYNNKNINNILNININNILYKIHSFKKLFSIKIIGIKSIISFIKKKINNYK